VPKPLSDAGSSIAESYDVEGSSIAIENIDARDIGLVHEMGGTIFSERVHGAIQLFQTAALLQTVTFDVEVLIPRISRILNWGVIIDTAGRCLNAQMSVGDVEATLPVELPFFTWDSVIDSERTIRHQAGGGRTNVTWLAPSTPPNTPSALLTFGVDQPDDLTATHRISLRGTTATFGAGTIVVTGMIYHALSAVVRPSSRGMPLPSW